MNYSRSDRQRLTHFGLSTEQYESLARYGCSVCRTFPQVLMKIDKDPITLEPVGVLCVDCAPLLVCREKKRLMAVADYLDRIYPPAETPPSTSRPGMPTQEQMASLVTKPNGY